MNNSLTPAIIAAKVTTGRLTIAARTANKKLREVTQEKLLLTAKIELLESRLEEERDKVAQLTADLKELQETHQEELEDVAPSDEEQEAVYLTQQLQEAQKRLECGVQTEMETINNILTKLLELYL